MPAAATAWLAIIEVSGHWVPASSRSKAAVTTDTFTGLLHSTPSAVAAASSSTGSAPAEDSSASVVPVSAPVSQQANHVLSQHSNCNCCSVTAFETSEAGQPTVSSCCFGAWSCR